MKKVGNTIAGLALMACALLCLYYFRLLVLPFARELEPDWVAESFSRHVPVDPVETLCYFLSWVGPLLLVLGLWRMGAIDQRRATFSALPAFVVMASLLYLLRPVTYKLGPTDAAIYYGLGNRSMVCALGLCSLCTLAYCGLSAGSHFMAVLRGRERPHFSTGQAVLLLGLCAIAFSADNLLPTPPAFALYRANQYAFLPQALYRLEVLLEQGSLHPWLHGTLGHVLAFGIPALLLYLPTPFAFRYAAPHPWGWGMLGAMGLALTIGMFQGDLDTHHFYRYPYTAVLILCAWMVLVGATGLMVCARATRRAKCTIRDEKGENTV